jgi:hypothetical protein
MLKKHTHAGAGSKSCCKYRRMGIRGFEALGVQEAEAGHGNKG